MNSEPIKNKNKSLVFREATIADLSILKEFEQGVIAAERPMTSSLKPDPIHYYDLTKLIESTDCYLIVALVGNEIIASAYARIKVAPEYKKFNQYGYLGFMFVKPEHRGNGYNLQIMDQLHRWLKNKNISEVRLDVYDINHPAIKAYEKAGYKKHLVEMRREI